MDDNEGQMSAKERGSMWLMLGRAAWLALAGLTLVYYLAVIPVDLQRYADSGDVVLSHASFDGSLSFSAYSSYLLALRYLIILVFLFAALLCFIEVGLKRIRYAPLGLLTSLMLITVPLIILLSDSGSDLPYARPWDSALEMVGLLLGLLGLLLLVSFYFVFPNGRINPAWMRWTGVVFTVGVGVLFILLGADEMAGDWLWPAAMLALLLALAVGISAQIYRYWEAANSEGKRQTRWVITSLVLLPLLLIGSIALSENSAAALVNVHLQMLAPALLPLSLAVSILKHGLWEVELSLRRVKGYSYLAGAVVIVSLAGVLWLNSGDQSQAYPAIEFESLPQTDRRLPVVIDTDMAADDWLAILFLLQRPDVEVKAIAVNGTGEAHCEPGVRNAVGLVALAGSDPIPVACGRETPLLGDQEFPHAWREGVDRMLGLPLPEGSNPHIGGDAVELLISTVEASPEKVILLTLGPLTNVAQAIEQQPAFLDNLQQIYIMGGALQVPGNVFYSGVGIDNKDAEWNVFVDPLAAKMVIESGAPVTLVPLDATNRVPADLDFYRRLQRNHRTPEAEFVYQVLSRKLDAILPGYYYFWDPLAAAVAVDESLGYLKEGMARVIADPGEHSGATRLVNGGVPVRYAKSADKERFLYEFLRALNQE
jgi:inosine-uridine nucleoside N-ribohydrolase